MLQRRIYLDYAAAAPERPESERAQVRAARSFGNPSSIHADGVESAKVLADARAECARALSAHPNEIFFTGSGTESDNLAVMGVFKHARLNPAFAKKDIHIITTAIEHPAILEACHHLEAVGAQVTYLPVGKEGRIHIKDLRAALRPETILVSIAYANSEIGVVQSIKDVAKEIRHFKKSHSVSGASPYPLLHTDACQAAQYLTMNVEQLGVDMLSMNGTKLGGPRGIGLLYVRRGTPVAPMLYGGGQESGLRSGTENISGACGLAAALTAASMGKDHEVSRLEEMRDLFIEKIQKQFPAVRVNGHHHYRLPNNVHISFPGIKSELLVLELDARGISASAGSACSSAKDTGSHVLAAMYGEGDEKKWGSVRFSFGPKTTARELEKVLVALGEITKKYEKYI
jgi:cysteine desulfurase